MTQAGITRAARHIPPNRLDADTLAALIGISPDRVRDEFGIEAKAVGAPGESALDHALLAGHALLDGIDPGSIDLLIYASSSPADYLLWSGGYKLHELLGLKHCRVQEINVGCIGSLHALEIARNYLLADPRIRRAVVIGAEGFHFDPAFANYGHAANEAMYILADGAAAVLLESDRDRPLPNHLGPFVFRTDSSTYEDRPIPAGGAKRPTTLETAEAGEQHLRMPTKDPRALKRFGLTYIQQYLGVIQEALAAIDRTGAPDLLISNQLKRPLQRILLSRLGMDWDQALYTMPHLGHVGTADILLGLGDLLDQDPLAPGQVAAVVSSGVGFAWGATTLSRV